MEQSLADVDVSEPGDRALIEQCGFDRRAPSLERPLEVTACELPRQRLRSEIAKQGMRRQRASFYQKHQSKPAMIGEDNPGTCVGIEDHVVVGAVPCTQKGSFVNMIAQPARFSLRIHCEPARHAKVDHEGLLAIELGQEVLGSAVETAHMAAGKPVREAGRERQAQIAAPRDDASEAAPLQNGGESPPNRFDFG